MQAFRDYYCYTCYCRRLGTVVEAKVTSCHFLGPEQVSKKILKEQAKTLLPFNFVYYMNLGMHFTSYISLSTNHNIYIGTNILYVVSVNMKGCKHCVH